MDQVLQGLRVLQVPLVAPDHKGLKVHRVLLEIKELKVLSDL